jgi:glyoxalase superfamily protein
MAVRIDLTLDCGNATRLAAFWKLALGYQDEPPTGTVRHQAGVAAAGRPPGQRR